MLHDILRILLVFMVLCIKPMSLPPENVKEEARDKLFYLTFEVTAAEQVAL